MEINTYTESLIDAPNLKPKSSSANNCAYRPTSSSGVTSVVAASSANPLTGDIIYQQQYGLGPSTSSGGDHMSLNEPPSSKYSPNYSGSKSSFTSRQQSKQHQISQQQQQQQQLYQQQQLSGNGSAQGSYNSLHVGTPLHDPQLHHLHGGGSIGGGGGGNSQNGGSRNSSPTIIHPQHPSSFRHSTPAESLNGSGTYFSSSAVNPATSGSTSVRSRVNSDSKCKPYYNYPSESNNTSNTNSNSGSKCKISTGGANSGGSSSGRKHATTAQSESNNLNNSSAGNYSSNNNNNNNGGSSNPLRHIFRQNSKNIEFNRQLSAPAAENQNNYNSVFNLQHHANILNSSQQQYYGSPNTNSLNRTKKKRKSFKLNGR